jgi:uncharacterized repeat protein (TIGR01451 family)
MRRTTGFRLLQIFMALILLLTSIGQAAAAQQADTVIVRMFQEDYLQVVQSIDPVNVIDYDSFVWLELTPPDLAILQSSGVNFFLEENAKLLVMNRFEFDPLLGEPEIPAEQQTSYEPGEEGFFVVQFLGPTRLEWLETLKSLGATVIQYQPNQAYIVLMTPETAVQVDQQDFVRWVGVYHAAYRIVPSLLEIGPSAPQQIIQNVDVTIFNNGQVAETIEVIRRLGGEFIQRFPAMPDESLITAIFALPSEAVVSVAQLNAVLWMNFISPEPQFDDEVSDQIVVGNHTAGVPFTGYNAWLTATGFDGTGVIVADVDSGMDTNNNATAHLDIRGRIAAFVPYTGAPVTDTDGHGTHTGGIIAGNGALGTLDPNGFRYGQGVAPNARLVVQNALDGSMWPPAGGGWPQLSRDSVINGAVASNNSWNTGPGGIPGYSAATRTHDMLVRDADFTTPGVAEPLIMVFSAGNAGPGASTITEPKEGKNLITVGASENFRSDPWVVPIGCGTPNNINNIVNFSSRGPARDGRILPNITAPGSFIASLRSATATYGPPFCEGVIDANYVWMSGTSQAAPHVTGAVALITQWWRTLNAGANPSPAMAKALLINGAVDMGVADIPNNSEGWGRMNLNNLINPGVPVIYEDQTTVFTTAGQTSTLVVGPADPTQPLKVTLVWSDAPGAGSGVTTPALVNDLDLTVRQGASMLLGNVFASGWSTTGGMPDRLNNVENVYIQNPVGAYMITVSAAFMRGNGIPPFTMGDPPDQDFALVCTNCAAPADLSITKSASPDPGTPGGTLTYTLTATNNGPEDATNVIVTDTLPTGLTFVSVTSSQGTCSGTVTCNLGTLPSGATATITIVVTVDAATGCGASLPNTASIVSDMPDPDLTNNTASTATLVDCPADLSITKSAAPGVTAGDDLTYTLTITNNGPRDATGVTVNDTLPTGVTLISATPSQGICGGAVSCSLVNLANGATATITIVVNVDPTTPTGTITNTATVTGNETDPTPGNNEASAETSVLGLCGILDDFNRPNGPLGSSWDARINRYRIRDNLVVVRAGGPIYWQPESYGLNQEACVTLTRINARSRQHGLLLKVQELNNWRKGAILVSYNARSGNVDVKARDVSAHRWTLVGSFTPSTPVVDGDQLRAQAWADGTVEVFVNNVSIGTADAGSFYVDKGGQIGLWFRNPLGDDDGDDEDDEDEKYILEDLLYEKIAGRRARLDDFGGGTIAAP